MANFKDVTVIPILATTRPQDEVAPSIETAERQGVLVMCREQTDEWIQLSAASPDANAVFAKTVKLLRDIRQRYAQSHAGTVL